VVVLPGLATIDGLAHSLLSARASKPPAAALLVQNSCELQNENYLLRGTARGLDTYIKEVLEENQLYTKKAPKSKKVLMQPGVVLDSLPSISGSSRAEDLLIDRGKGAVCFHLDKM
jgi:hypothetical protein